MLLHQLDGNIQALICTQFIEIDAIDQCKYHALNTLQLLLDSVDGTITTLNMLFHAMPPPSTFSLLLIVAHWTGCDLPKLPLPTINFCYDTWPRVSNQKHLPGQ